MQDYLTENVNKEYKLKALWFHSGSAYIAEVETDESKKELIQIEEKVVLK